METADDFLAAADDYEEAGGKWRAGDGVKSMRFFQRALETYHNGLQKFPQSLDLAYNKARLFYDMYSNPLTRQQIQHQVQQVLDEALSAHRYALSLDSENADTLFNTAQVLTSIGEELLSSDQPAKAFELVQDAVQLQAKCISVQEKKFEDNLTLQQQLANQSGSSSTTEPTTSESPTPENTSQSDDDGTWAAVIEPVTALTLLDTAIAQLYTLRTLCEVCTLMIGSPTVDGTELSKFAAEIEARSGVIMGTKILKYIGLAATDTRADEARVLEATLAMAVFSASLLEYSFRRSSINLANYIDRLETSFAFTTELMEWSADGGDPEFDVVAAMVARAQAIQTMAITVFDLSSADLPKTSTTGKISTTLWSTLSSSITSLTNLAKRPSNTGDEGETIQTHLAETTLLLRRLAAGPFDNLIAQKNEQALLRNAMTHYGNVIKISASTTTSASRPLTVEEWERANAVRRRQEVVQRISERLAGQGSTTPQPTAITELEADFREMVDEGLLNEQDSL